MQINLSKYSNPSMLLQSKALSKSKSAAFFICLDTIGTKVSLTKVDLPEPDTPVTTLKQPTAKDALMFFKLLPWQPCKVKKPLGSTRLSGIAMLLRPVK